MMTPPSKMAPGTVERRRLMTGLREVDRWRWDSLPLSRADEWNLLLRTLSFVPPPLNGLVVQPTAVLWPPSSPFVLLPRHAPTPVTT